jgi:hypothetical protein
MMKQDMGIKRFVATIYEIAEERGVAKVIRNKRGHDCYVNKVGTCRLRPKTRPRIQSSDPGALRVLVVVVVVVMVVVMVVVLVVVLNLPWSRQRMVPSSPSSTVMSCVSLCRFKLWRWWWWW